MTLKEKNVIVTGCSRGIGKAIVECFAENGANVWACARKETLEFEKFCKEISEENQVFVKSLYFDMTDGERMREVLKKVFLERKPIDCLVNCAGEALFSFFPLMKISEIRRIFDINLFSVMEMTQLVVNQMIKRKRGCIVNISSIAGIDLQTNNSAYGVSKAAINAFTKELAMELGQFDIRVNAVAPGIVDTDMVKEMGVDNYNMRVSSSALSRAANPQEIAKVVKWLCSEEASYVNGQIIRVDGGMI